MLARLKGLFHKFEELSISQPQREAMLDLLLWTMYADRVLALPENERIDQLPDELSWDSVTPFPLYVSTALARVRESLADPDEAQALMDDVYARLGTEAMRRRAYDACRDLSGLDGDVSEEEAAFLERVRTRFGL